jgi:hypothetical protein
MRCPAHELGSKDRKLLLQILADAIERAGTLDRAAIKDAMAASDMTTVIGPVDWCIELGGLWAQNAPR